MLLRIALIDHTIWGTWDTVYTHDCSHPVFTSRVLFPAIPFTMYVVSICYVSCTHLYQESIYLLNGKFVSLTRNAPFPEHAIARGEDFRGEEQICRRKAGPGPLRGIRSPGLPWKLAEYAMPRLMPGTPVSVAGEGPTVPSCWHVHFSLPRFAGLACKVA